MIIGRSLQIDWALPKEAFVAKRDEEIKPDISTTEAKIENEPTDDTVDDDKTHKDSEKQNIRKQSKYFVVCVFKKLVYMKLIKYGLIFRTRI